MEKISIDIEKFLTKNFNSCKCGSPSWKGSLCKSCFAKEDSHKNSLKVNATAILLKHCGVSKRHCIASFSDYPKNFPSKNGWDSLGQGFFVTGSRGVGKTHLAVAMMRHEIENLPVSDLTDRAFRFSSKDLPLFVFVPEVIQEFAESRMIYRYAESISTSVVSTKDLIDRYSNARLLVLDDLGSTEGYKGWIDDLFIILDKRYREMMRTIITSNLSLDDIARKFDDRISSRIFGMCKIVELRGKDKRTTKSQLPATKS